MTPEPASEMLHRLLRDQVALADRITSSGRWPRDDELEHDDEQPAGDDQEDAA